MYYPKSYKSKRTESKDRINVSFNSLTYELQKVGVADRDGLIHDELRSVSVDPCDKFKDFKFEDFRLENLQAAGVELREMSLGTDPDIADKINNLNLDKALDKIEIEKQSKSE